LHEDLFNKRKLKISMDMHRLKIAQRREGEEGG